LAAASTAATVEAVTGDAAAVEAATIEKTVRHDFAADAAQLTLATALRSKFASIIRRSKTGGPNLAEAKNITERWLIGMVNAAAPDGGPYKIFRSLPVDSPVYRQLQTELAAAGAANAPAILREVHARVAGLLESPAGATDETVGCDAGELIYSATLRATEELAPAFEFRHKADSATARLIPIGGCTATVAAALRYAALLPAGQQWGVPRAHVDALYKSWGVRNEAFASPFNSRMVGRPDAKFCSLFPDTDAAFGSLGDFFELDVARGPPGNWLVNPPFIDELLARAAHKCLDALAGQNPPVFFFVMPAWRDCEAYAALHKSRFAVAELTLVPGEYYYESPAGERIDTRAPSIYFALAPEVAPAAEAAQRATLRGALEHFKQLSAL
jgi:hypothetical protein